MCCRTQRFEKTPQKVVIQRRTAFFSDSAPVNLYLHLPMVLDKLNKFDEDVVT
jgi:hypothetical protein